MILWYVYNTYIYVYKIDYKYIYICLQSSVFDITSGDEGQHGNRSPRFGEEEVVRFRLRWRLIEARKTPRDLNIIESIEHQVLQVPAECAVSFSFCWGCFSLWFATSRSQGLHGGTEASISFAGFDETGQSCTSPSLRSISSMWCWLVCSSSLKTKTGSDRLPDSRITCKTTQNNKKETRKTEQISITVWYLSMSACKAFAPIYSWYLTILRSASLDVFLWGYGCMPCWRIAYLQYCNRRHNGIPCSI